MESIIRLLASFLAVTIVLTLHEFAHAFVAYKCGDPTAKWAGRMTLNPTKHFDLIGLVLFALAGFGWAKPVPINPQNFKHYKRGYFLTSAAGILMNYVTAFLFYPVFDLTFNAFLPTGVSTYGQYFAIHFTQLLFSYSLSFCVFNLLPLYPLDGFRMVEALNKKRGKVFQFLRNYGHYILIALIAVSYICERMWNLTANPVFVYIDLLGMAMQFLQSVFKMPITAFWGLILK